MSGQKILILVNHEITIYKFRKEFILKLLNDDYEVYISSPNGEKIKEFVSAGCIHIDTKVERRGINPVKDFKLLHDYWKIFKKIKPDIVFSYTIKPNIYGGLISRILNVPMVVTITGLGSAIETNKWLRSIIIKLYRISLKCVQKGFVQNTKNFKFFDENRLISKKQLELVAGSGVNLTQFKYQKYPKLKVDINFIYIGRLMKEKGILELFEAAEYFKRKSLNINFHILGFLEDNLKEIIKELIDKDVIIYHGQQSDIRPYIKKANAIIHPSYHEGLSNVLLEAAATGRPILASDIPGCRETFDEGITGFGFEPKSAESLIRTIEKFIKLSHEKKKEMGILGRQKVETEFDRQDVVDAYINEVNI